MSRNLGRVDCQFCNGIIVHDETPRPITPNDAGAYFNEYDGMMVAASTCRGCGAKYLAWVRGHPDWVVGHLAYKNVAAPGGHIDLSFLSTFNDEPGDEDRPLGERMAKTATIESTSARKPLTPGDPVTLVLPDHVVMCEVSSSTKEGFGCILTSRGAKSIVSEHELKAEGVTWLFGYHLADSPEVKACRVGKALE